MRWQHSATGGVGEGGERPPFVVDDVLGLAAVVASATRTRRQPNFACLLPRPRWCKATLCYSRGSVAEVSPLWLSQ